MSGAARCRQLLAALGFATNNGDAPPIRHRRVSFSAEPPRVDRAAVMKLLQDHRGAFGIAPLVRKDSFSRLEDAASQSPPPEATAAAAAAARYRHALRLYSSTRARSAPAERG